MSGGGGSVDSLLRALDERLGPTARVSWVAADGTGVAGASPAPGVEALVGALLGAVQPGREVLGDDVVRVTLETGARTLLVHAHDEGTLVVDALAGVNLALVRRTVVAALDAPRVRDDAPPGGAGAAAVRRTVVRRPVPRREPGPVDDVPSPADGPADAPVLGRVLAALLDQG